MLTYLIILLDDTSVSYCPYEVTAKEHRLMPLDVLKRGIVWAMKENVNVQFVYPDYPLPQEYNELIETIDHTKIKPEAQADGADVVVLTEWKERISNCAEGATCIIHASRQELADNIENVKRLIAMAARVNVVLTDVEIFTDSDTEEYKELLQRLLDHIVEQYAQGLSAQLNLITDRLVIDYMNNCGAGSMTVTLAPDGHFYICPAYYVVGNASKRYNQTQSLEASPTTGQLSQSLEASPTTAIGGLTTGLAIANSHLFHLDYAPICRVCDAYHCRRCIWMNDRLTGDVNTPSHQQCVVSHLERNASRRLQQKMMAAGIRLKGTKEIPEVDYLDPFVIATRWK